MNTPCTFFLRKMWISSGVHEWGLASYSFVCDEICNGPCYKTGIPHSKHQLNFHCTPPFLHAWCPPPPHTHAVLICDHTSRSVMYYLCILLHMIRTSIYDLSQVLKNCNLLKRWKKIYIMLLVGNMLFSHKTRSSSNKQAVRDKWQLG